MRGDARTWRSRVSSWASALICSHTRVARLWYMPSDLRLVSAQRASGTSGKALKSSERAVSDLMDRRPLGMRVSLLLKRERSWRWA